MGRVFGCIAGLICASMCISQSHAQDLPPDSSLVVQAEPVHSPRGALLRAASVPGWGQWYNRQYFKIPVVYTALGGLAGLMIYFNGEFKRADDAYQYAARLGEEPNAFAEFEDEYIAFGSPPASSLRTFRDGQRRNRDLSFIGIVLVYGLSLLDAYVNAHLSTFDVGDDLSVHTQGLSAPLSIRVTFTL